MNLSNQRHQKLTLRSRIGLITGRLAAWASRKSGRGSGGMIGGKMAYKISPHLLAELAYGRRIAIVSATNGKTTTTAMLRRALETKGSVASNTRGDNMTSGVLSALISQPVTDFAVFEVDEMHTYTIAQAIKPEVFVLLNLSRDQLDRVGEMGTVEKRMRQAVNCQPDAIIVANCDDPLITSVAMDAKNVIWVSVGDDWVEDSASFPRGGGVVIRQGRDWYVKDSEYRRPQPDWELRDYELINVKNPDQRYRLDLKIPGRANRGNACQALLGAHALGVDFAKAIEAVNTVESVAGRYSHMSIKGRDVHALLAKNPAGWHEALSMLDPDADDVIISVNGQVADSTDLSWLWDVDFEVLAQKYERVFATGDRGYDLAVRLQYAGVDVFYQPDVGVALDACAPGGNVEVLANYTAFYDAMRIFDKISVED